MVANVVGRPPLPLSVMLGYGDLPYPPEMAESLAEPVRLALSLGVNVTRLRIKSLHPIPALLEAVAEEDPGIFVFGPGRRKMIQLPYWPGAHAYRSQAPSHVLDGVFIAPCHLVLSVN